VGDNVIVGKTVLLKGWPLADGTIVRVGTCVGDAVTVGLLVTKSVGADVPSNVGILDMRVGSCERTEGEVVTVEPSVGRVVIVATTVGSALAIVGSSVAVGTLVTVGSNVNPWVGTIVTVGSVVAVEPPVGTSVTVGTLVTVGSIVPLFGGAVKVG
jgi:hypothetical protein